MTRQIEFSLPEFSYGFHIVTDLVLDQLGALPQTGMLHLFIKHTSAGLTINENADPTVLKDFKTFLPIGSRSGTPSLYIPTKALTTCRRILRLRFWDMRLPYLLLNTV